MSESRFNGFVKEFRWWKKYRFAFSINAFKNQLVSSYLGDMYAYWRLDEKDDGSIQYYKDWS